jgi:acylphosphatase
MNAVASRRWLISGRVQGVGFRWFVYQRASDLGLIGWTANCQDGRVEVIAHGPAESLNRFESALAIGPRFAHVDNVEKTDCSHEVGHLKSFTIK